MSAIGGQKINGIKERLAIGIFCAILLTTPVADKEKPATSAIISTIENGLLKTSTPPKITNTPMSDKAIATQRRLFNFSPNKNLRHPMRPRQVISKTTTSL